MHSKGCVSHFVSNLKSDKLESSEVTEMLLTWVVSSLFPPCRIICVLKDSARHTNALLADFSESNGYLVMRDFLLQ